MLRVQMFDIVYLVQGVGRKIAMTDPGTVRTHVQTMSNSSKMKNKGQGRLCLTLRKKKPVQSMRGRGEEQKKTTNVG